MLNNNIIWRVEFEDNVTAVSNYSLSNMSNLRQVFFTDKITKIGQNAFYNCSKLSAVSLVDGVTDIMAYAFSECPLGYIYIPLSVKTIANNSFYGLDNSKLKVYSESNYVKKWCNDRGVEFFPVLYGENTYELLDYDSFSTTALKDKMISYKSSNINNWGMKKWSDSTDNKVERYNNLLKMEIASGKKSYVTAYNTVIHNNNIKNNKIKITIKAQSNVKENLNHIYSGFVSIDANGNENDYYSNNQFHYKLGNVVESYENNGVYNAIIEYDFALDFVGDYLYQIRFGKNDDSVSGSVSIISFKVETPLIKTNFLNWYHKDWSDDNGSVVSVKEKSISLTAKSGGYATAYGSTDFPVTEDIVSAKIKIKARSSNIEALEKIYAGYYSGNPSTSGFKEAYEKTALNGEIKKISSNLYEANLETLVDISSGTNCGLQVRLGRNTNTLSKETTVEITEILLEKSGVKVEVGDRPKITALLLDNMQDFDMNNDIDRSNLIFNISSMHFLSNAYKQVSNYDAKGLYIVYDKNHPYYMSTTRVSFDDGIRKMNYSSNAISQYLKSVKNQSLFFGVSHELSHCYVNDKFDNNYCHNADDSEVNMRTFLAREVGFVYRNIPLYNDNGKIFYSDMVYDSNSNLLEGVRTLNSYDAWFIYKEDVNEGYIHDLSFDVYLSLYKLLEKECKGKGVEVFSELMSGTSTNTSKINEQLKSLFPESNIKFDSLKDHAQKVLLCYNYLVSRTKSGSISTLCSTYPDIAKLIRKSIYCTHFDKYWEDKTGNGGQKDCIYKFIGDVNQDHRITSADYTTLKNYKNNKTIDINILSCGDINFDGKITDSDINEIKNCVNKQASTPGKILYNLSADYCK